MVILIADLTITVLLLAQTIFKYVDNSYFIGQNIYKAAMYYINILNLLIIVTSSISHQLLVISMCNQLLSKTGAYSSNSH